MVMERNPYTFESLTSSLAQTCNLQVIGPSGSGKSHLIKHLAIKSMQDGYAPVFLPAKYFSKKFSDLLERSIAHLYPGKATELLNDFDVVGKCAYLIVDGINECPNRKLPALLETLQAFVLRKRCPVIITTQKKIELPCELEGVVVELAYLSNSEKGHILKVYLDEAPTKIKEILGALKTPFEVSLAAESLSELGKAFTKYELFYSYTRKCLGNGESGSLGFRILVRIAEILSERLSTAIPISEFHRIAEGFIPRSESSPPVIEVILKSKIVEIAQRSFSFTHEMIQRFFEAESLLSKCESTPILTEEMVKPRNHHLAEFILAAQPNSATIRKLLPLPAFYGFFHECIQGHFGPKVEAAIKLEIFGLFAKNHKELDQIDVFIEPGKDYFHRIRIIGQSISEYEAALLVSVGEAFISMGLFVEETLALLRATERACLSILDHKGLPEDERIKLLNNFFASLYLWQSADSPAIGRIVNALCHGHSFQREIAPRISTMLRELTEDLDAQPLGILYIMCELFKYDPFSVRQLPKLLRRCWDTGIYNLRIDALESVQSLQAYVTDTLRDEVIQLINSLDWEGNILVSTTMNDVLCSYGAIETIVTVEEAKNEIHLVLYPPKNLKEEIKGITDIPFEEFLNYSACNLYYRMFEDIFQDVY